MRKRQPSEPIAALGDDIRQMAQKAYCNLDSKAQESLALNQFYKILPIEMKCRCINKNCETVADAVDDVDRYEAILGDEYDKKKANVRAVGSNETEHQAMLQRIEKRLELLEKGSTPLKNVKDWRNQIQTRPAPRNEKRGTCFVCNSPDHFFRNCPTFIQCKSCTAPGHDDGKDKASSQGKESSSSTYNQGNDKPNRPQTSIPQGKQKVRTGHIEEIRSQWDNGFYTNGMIDGTKVIFLIDKHMTKFGYVEPTFHKEIQCSMVPGVIDTQAIEMVENFVNCSDADVTLHENLHIGVCEPYEDVFYSERVASINRNKENVTEMCEGKLPEYLKDLFKRSSAHLDYLQKEALETLLIRYQSVFAKSTAELGRTDRVQHKYRSFHSYKTAATTPTNWKTRNRAGRNSEDARSQGHRAF
ncbi:hypothetical protein CHS0354_016111 [Potamilus streckersoni]|uniref:CCHC-type domain-containing protein n=1 Tax=Potamilus streckersoni TaxID=2493646 RepID=A0AAE0T223_9BIVA|nr:hypothetical protein CHS0354_016111 [Potamilus streckersoni]